MPPRQKKNALNIGDMFATLGQELRKQAVEPNILRYKPHDKQVRFHSSSAKTRLYIGGNRSGKTVGGITEDIWFLMRKHPYRKLPDVPIRGRIVCVDFNQGINQIIIPKLKQWLPPSLLINGSWDDSYNSDRKLLTLTNGSTCELMTYEQKLDAFAGTSRHFVHFDEEPPYQIYRECQMRLIDTDGDMWITMTPINGMTWIHDQIYEPGVNGSKPDIDVVEVNIHDNPYLKQTAIDRVLGDIEDPDEREARESGKFIQLGGLVYKGFSRSKHVIEPVNPRDPEYREWGLARSMDHGFNNPTAWLWHLISPNGQHIITFAEHYAREMIVSEHARVVHEMDSQFGRVPDFTVGDPAIEQRNGVNGTSILETYASHGIYIAPGNNDVLTGVERVTNYLKTNSGTERPTWQITENCPNLVRELERLRWKTFASRTAQYQNNVKEEIHKKDDHAADAARYFFTMMPDLTPDPKEVTRKPPEDTVTERYDQALARLAGATTDWRKHQTEWEWE